MKVLLILALIAQIFTQVFTQEFAQECRAVGVSSNAHFSEGQPGCLPQIGSRALSPVAESQLSVVCKKLRTDYLTAAQMLVDSPQTLQKEIATAIQNGKGVNFPRPPYAAILFSVLTGDQTQLPALKSYAALEKQKKVRYQYASAAVERLAKGKCKNYTEEAYAEICTGKDSVLSRLVSLNKAATNKAGGKQ